jgi:hypothetical protein
MIWLRVVVNATEPVGFYTTELISFTWLIDRYSNFLSVACNMLMGSYGEGIMLFWRYRTGICPCFKICP